MMEQEEAAEQEEEKMINDALWNCWRPVAITRKTASVTFIENMTIFFLKWKNQHLSTQQPTVFLSKMIREVVLFVVVGSRFRLVPPLLILSGLFGRMEQLLNQFRNSSDESALRDPFSSILSSLVSKCELRPMEIEGGGHVVVLHLHW